MHEVRGANIKLQNVLAKLRGEPKPLPRELVFSSSDIASAKTVLDRLLTRLVVEEIKEL
jgi:hypothetical protein